MATNIKHIKSEKYQKALTLEERVSLEKIICSYRDSNGSLKITLNEISNMLEKIIQHSQKRLKVGEHLLICKPQITLLLLIIVLHVLSKGIVN